MTTTEIIVTESRELHQLTAHMQRHVDRTLAADRKGGEALWEKALAVIDARNEATKVGEWGAFLKATGQHERGAQRLIAIADRGRKEERFRTAIISGWLTFSVGAIAAQADDELLTNLLEQPTPPTRAQITARPDTGVGSRIAAQPDTGVGSLANNAPARPVATPTEASRSVAYAAEIAGIYRQRIAATETTAELDAIKKEIAADMRLSPSGVIDLAAQISSRLTAAPPASPAAPAEPVAPTITTTSPLDAVSEALRKNDTKAAYAAVHLISNDLDRTRAYAAVDARIDGKSLGIVLAMLEQPTTPALSAFPPGSVEAGIGAIARRLQSGSQISTDSPWAEKLRIQLDAARETMQPAVYETWAARLDAVQAALGVLESQQRKPIIEAPQAAPVKKTTSQAVLLEYAESMLAGVIEAIPDTAITLVAALVCEEYEPSSGDDPREALFQTLKILAKDNLDVVETAIQWQKGI